MSSNSSFEFVRLGVPWPQISARGWSDSLQMRKKWTAVHLIGNASSNAAQVAKRVHQRLRATSVENLNSAFPLSISASFLCFGSPCAATHPLMKPTGYLCLSTLSENIIIQRTGAELPVLNWHSTIGVLHPPPTRPTFCTKCFFQGKSLCYWHRSLLLQLATMAQTK